MKIRFKIKDGKSVTVCPNGRTWNSEVVNVGDEGCVKCVFFEKVSHYSSVLICSFRRENAIKTYEDGVDDCIEVIKNIGNFSYVDKLRTISIIMSKLKELKANRDKS
jgi:hypothetical protein